MKKQLFTAFVLVAFTVGMTATVTAASDDGQQSSDTNVTVASQTAVDVHPQQLTYENINPGNIASSSSEKRSFGAIELENVGSTDIERVWVNATQTSSQDPFFGSSTPGDFNAANFLQLKPTSTSGPLEGDTGNWTFVNRKEFGAFNSSLKPEYINAPDGENYYVDTSKSTAVSAAEVSTGRFRMGNQEYFWALPTDGTGCDGTGDNTFDTLLVAEKPHNATDTTPVDFTADDSDGGQNPDSGDEGYNTISGTDYNLYNVSDLTNSEYGIAGSGTDGISGGVALQDGSESGQIRVYDIFTECDTDNDGNIEDTDAPNVVRSKYNVEAVGADDLTGVAESSATQYLVSSTQLDPGEAVNLDVRMMIPRGIPQGIVTEGSLSVIVSTSNAS